MKSDLLESMLGLALFAALGVFGKMMHSHSHIASYLALAGALICAWYSATMLINWMLHSKDELDSEEK